MALYFSLPLGEEENFLVATGVRMPCPEKNPLQKKREEFQEGEVETYLPTYGSKFSSPPFTHT